jgi:hypothetical protein
MVLIGFDHFHSDEYGDARGVRGASSRARETRPLRALLGQLNNWWPRKCNGVDTDPKPPGFSAVLRRIEGCPQKLRYGTGTDRGPRNEPKKPAATNLRMDTKEGKTTEL